MCRASRTTALPIRNAPGGRSVLVHAQLVLKVPAQLLLALNQGDGGWGSCSWKGEGLHCNLGDRQNAAPTLHRSQVATKNRGKVAHLPLESSPLPVRHRHCRVAQLRKLPALQQRAPARLPPAPTLPRPQTEKSETFHVQAISNMISFHHPCTPFGSFPDLEEVRWSGHLHGPHPACP